MSKRIIRVLSMVLTLVMMLSLSTPAFAWGGGDIGNGWDRQIGEDDFREIEPAEEVEEEEVFDYFQTYDEDSKIQVTVAAPMGSLPMLAELRVESIDPESVSEAVTATVGENAWTLMAVDLSFWMNGIEIEPEDTVRVKITADELQDKQNLTLVHIPDEEEPETLDLLDESVSFAVGTNEIAFETESFSSFAVVWDGSSIITEDNIANLTFTNSGNSYYDGTVTLVYVDSNNNVIPRPANVQLNNSYNYSSSTTTVNISDYAKPIDGYTFNAAYVIYNNNAYQTSNISVTRGQHSYYGYNYYTPHATFNSSVSNVNLYNNNIQVYLIYDGETVVAETSVDVIYGYMNGDTFVGFDDEKIVSTNFPGEKLSTSDYSNSNPYAFLEYDFKEYTYKETRLDTPGGTAISPVLRMYNDVSVPQYTSSTNPGNNSWSYLEKDQKIYVIYEKTPFTEGIDSSSSEGGDTPESRPDPLPAAKKVHDNGDGTYDITLSVTGKATHDTQTTRASVIVIFDISGSMNYSFDGSSTSGGERMNAAKDATYTLAETLLGIKDDDGNHLVEMALIPFSTNATPYDFSNGNGVYFTTNYNDNGTASNPDRSGFRYAVQRQTANGATNWDAALREADKLTASTTAPTYVVFVTDGGPTVRVARANSPDAELYSEVQLDNRNSFTWGNSLNDTSYFGTGYHDHTSHVDAAVNAGIDIREHHKKLFGIGLSKDANVVKDLIDRVYDGVVLPQGEIAHYYSAESLEQIQTAFAQIAKQVSSDIGYNNVTLDDGVTQLSTIEIALVGGATEFVCRKGDKTDPLQNPVWDDAPAPEVDSSNHVKWNPVPNGDLEEDTTYSITFTVWPSQEAFDLIADVNNGIVRNEDGTIAEVTTPALAYSKLPPEVKKQVVLTSSGTYTLMTNTDFNLRYTYNSKPYVQDESENMENLGMPLAAEFFSIEKKWNNLLPQDSRYAKMKTDALGYLVNKSGQYIKDEDGNNILYSDPKAADYATYYVDLLITKNGEEYTRVTLYQDKADPASAWWKWDQMFISSGVLTSSDNTITLREYGYDYTVSELPSDAYYWELHAVTYHPMDIDGINTMLKLVETEDAPADVQSMDVNTKLVSGGKTYYKFYASAADEQDQKASIYVVESEDATMIAENQRRSYLNITKTVEGTDGAGYDKDTFFEYTVTMDYPDGKHPDEEGYEAEDDGFWFSAFDPELPVLDDEGNPVLDDEGNPKKGAAVMDLEVTGATAEVIGGKPTGYWYFDNGGTVTFEIKAGWNVRFTNLFAGTTYVVTENVEDMPDGFSFNKVEATAVMNGEEQDYTTTVDETIPSKISGAIEASNTNYTVTYTNDYAGYFYVYHSGAVTEDGYPIVERYPMAENGVLIYSEENPFDITKLVDTSKHLYGGYYKDYAGKSEGFDAAAAAALTYTEEGKSFDKNGTIYAGGPGVWVKEKAYLTNGMKIEPTSNTVYYLKEVPAEKYLQPYLHYTYKWTTGELTAAWLISDVDDANYTEAGFYIFSGPSDIAKVTKSLTITNTGTNQTSIKLTPTSLFDSNGFLTYRKVMDDTGVIADTGFAAGCTVKQYWITLDGLAVTSTEGRLFGTIDNHNSINTNAKDLTGDDLKSVITTSEQFKTQYVPVPVS